MITLLLIFPGAVLLGLMIGLGIDRVRVGGDGIWYGPDQPPDDFVGFWDRGMIVVQWPEPRVYSDIVGGSVATDDMIADPDYPGMITTRQELARRRQENDSV